MEETGTLEISEGQLMFFLPHLLTGNAGAYYLAVANGYRSGRLGGITHWREAAQDLLRTYAMEQTINEALDDCKDVSQAENENKMACAARLNNLENRCGNVYEEDEKINL